MGRQRIARFRADVEYGVADGRCLSEEVHPHQTDTATRIVVGGPETDIRVCDGSQLKEMRSGSSPQNCEYDKTKPDKV
jgi:hypothetical protein